MISWALRRNTDSAKDAPGADDTQVDVPDTPAPVFAVRALKTALFGTPAPRERAAPVDKAAQQKAASASQPANRSPTKPTGILLTPGTGTTRRKRVSFGRDVKAGAVIEQPSTSGLPNECPGKFPSPWAGNGNGSETSTNSSNGPHRAKTRLTAAMENARKGKTTESATDAKEPEDAWEEVDEEDDFDADVTVDLNEPHSRSGKYWKSYFESYHADAKAEMEKLVKYKLLAKSYAKKKDAEAVDLNQKLREEQEKVKGMEQKVAELGRQVVTRARRTGGGYDPGLMDELTKQTALSLEYKKQVDELEAILLENADYESDDKEQRQRRVASPRVHKTLLETQRELRRARSQVRELDKLREERDRLRSELKFAEQRAAKLVEENRKISGDLTHGTSTIRDLERKLAESKAETLQKDSELKNLRRDYDKLKDDAKARYSEAHQVLQKKNDKISDLQDEIVSLRTEGVESRWAARAKNLEAKLKIGNEQIQAPDRESALKFLETAEEESTQLLKELGELRKVSIQRGLIPPTTSSGLRQRPKSSLEGRTRDSYQDDALVSSRALREKIEAEMGKRPASAVLSDRGNLQDSRSSASSGRSAHLQEEQPLRTNRQAERKSWTAGLTTAPNSGSRATIDDIMGDFHAKQQQRRRASPSEPPIEATWRREQPNIRPLDRENDLPHIDLIQDNFARLGGPTDANSSAVWELNTSRTTLPASRKLSALASLQRKRAERMRGLVDRNKENVNPY
ncbi:spindle pole body formation-associated protein-domain-containing protein [Lasiosphaeria hispida]|uniref:Spindle pole body formation-associated protein-domain-containing protein n=1 Tax=Lasiosphaeria hispida TaxID=260671 RepID=A0AAJ0HPE2_9PEZI|nr:spindle pole body formation-associated protein-domain-containing protein [Lasiosphaeria hispida]